MKRFLIHKLVLFIHALVDKLEDFVFFLVTKHLDDIFTGEDF